MDLFGSYVELHNRPDMKATKLTNFIFKSLQKQVNLPALECPAMIYPN
jgi:hypothetical protein